MSKTRSSPSTPVALSETAQMFMAAVNAVIESRQPWRIEELEALLRAGGFTHEEVYECGKHIEDRKREFRAGLVGEQLAKILVGEPIDTDACPKIIAMGRPKKQVAPGVAAQMGQAISSIQNPFNLPQWEHEELLRRELDRYNKQNVGMQNVAYGSAIQAAKDPWKIIP